MIKYDYTNYQENIKSIEAELEPISFDLQTELFNRYIEILEVINFNPIENPPAEEEKKEYILNYIVPILQIYCMDFKGILEIEDMPDNVTITMVAESIVFINDDFDFKSIMYYATFFMIEAADNKISLKLYFSTKKVALPGDGLGKPNVD